MAVYYKFKSAKDYDTIPVDGHFLSVGALKARVYESKHLDRGTICDLVVTNAQTEEEYKEDSMIPRNTAVLIKRVPGRRGLPIVATRVAEEPKLELVSKEDDVQIVNNGFVGLDSSGMKAAEDTEWDVFGNDLYDIPDVPQPQTSHQVQDIHPPSKIDEDSKIQALIDTPALDWQSQPAGGFGHGRGFGRKINNRNFGFEQKNPPPGYVCHRCNTPGHFIQNCPTNGDRNFDIKRAKPPTGIPKSMLMPTPDGSYALPDGAAGVLKPNEAAFEKEIEGLPSTRSVSDFPPELKCPLCKEVMKDAVLTSKCCFKSFCDKCIRDYIISKSMCVCGETNVLADDLLPNKTLRDTINRMLESNTSSAENGGSAYHVQDMESRNPQAKIMSPTHSAASKGGQKPPPPPLMEGNSNIQGSPAMVLDNEPAMVAEGEKIAKGKDVPEATHESVSAREPASQGSALLVDEEVQQKPAPSDAGKKKKKKKARLPPNAAEMQWRMAQDFAPENYMMPMGPTAYNPYWGMQPGMEGFVPPYTGHMPYMGFGPGPMDVPFGGVMPHDPFGGQGCMMPFPPQRDLADFGMGFNPGPPPPMSREEFEARKANLRKRKEMDRRFAEGRNLPKDREFGREVSSSGDVSSIKQKAKPILPSSSSEQHYLHRSERPSPDRRSRDPEISRLSSKTKSEHDDYHHHHRERHEDRYRDERHDDRNRDERHDRSRDVRDEPRRRAHEEDHKRRDYDNVRHQSSSYHKSESSSAVVKSSSALPEPPSSKHTAAMDKKHKASVFSRISFPEREAAAAAAAAASKKQRKLSSESPASGSGHRKGSSNGYSEDHQSKPSSKKREAASVEYESSDDDRHFKRRPSRYEPSPPPVAAEWEEEQPRHSRGSKERDRHYSKHR
ncbi:ubiquitin-protein ligase [Lithospermum erythrorhizon]|uniref:Ubiquitin-protein ligase n=1 Tax=Lithospermum erythrorhizon TaxID=34254 RepID=A0AAV3R4U1_LITER